MCDFFHLKMVQHAFELSSSRKADSHAYDTEF